MQEGCALQKHSLHLLWTLVYRMQDVGRLYVRAQPNTYRRTEPTKTQAKGKEGKKGKKKRKRGIKTAVLWNKNQPTQKDCGHIST